MIKKLITKVALANFLLFGLTSIVLAIGSNGPGNEQPVGAIPEPGIWALFLIGGIAFAISKWKR